jgi:hypothetical protein
VAYCVSTGDTFAHTFFTAADIGSWPATTSPSSSVHTVSASFALPKLTGGAFEYASVSRMIWPLEPQ